MTRRERKTFSLISYGQLFSPDLSLGPKLGNCTLPLFQGSINIVEGGRFRLISDGENNNMIMLAISKVKASDEGKYKLTIENCHGTDEAEFMLFVSGK